ncbi:MAG: hypothetical protein WD830_05765, partial [Chloroflexota bacterium]
RRTAHQRPPRPGTLVLGLSAGAGADRDSMLSGQITLSMRDPAFMQAMYEMAASSRTPAVDSAAPQNVFDLEALAQTMDLGWQGQPYFQVLGTAGETEHGYRTRKYRSNGTADTVTKGIFMQKGLVEIVPNTRPRGIILGAGNTPEVLAEVFLGNGAKPRLDDLAVWWHRSTNLQERFGAQPTRDQLVTAATDDLGLAEDEAAAIFDLPETDGSDDGEEAAEA